MPGARCARSLACKTKKHTSIVTTVTPEPPGIPRAMVLTVSFVLSPVIGLCCHRHQRDTSRKLERQRRGVKTTRLRRSLSHVSSSALSASIASRPAFVTIASRPCVGRDRIALCLRLPNRQALFLKIRTRSQGAIRAHPAHPSHSWAGRSQFQLTREAAGHLLLARTK
jgi:hypothetical protein